MRSASRTASMIASNPASRPAPVMPQAKYPSSGAITRTPRSRKICTFSRVAACSHIFTFMAGATTTGAVVARYKVVRKSSATPRANFAMISAVAGAMTSASMRCATAMCSIALSTLAGASAANNCVMTFCPVRAANVSGATNSCALRVITTWISICSCCSRRTSSAAL